MEYTFLVINIIMILMVLILHPYFIVEQKDYLTGNWLYLFLAIEFPLLIYTLFNIIVIICFKMKDYVSKILKYRYAAIDFLIFPIMAGLIASIVKFVENDNALDKAAQMTT